MYIYIYIYIYNIHIYTYIYMYIYMYIMFVCVSMCDARNVAMPQTAGPRRREDLVRGAGDGWGGAEGREGEGPPRESSEHGVAAQGQQVLGAFPRRPLTLIGTGRGGRGGGGGGEGGGGGGGRRNSKGEAEGEGGPTAAGP